jgi:hypothetical protein
VTVKFAALVAVPAGVVTLILPVVAPDGTFVSIRVPWALTVNDAAATPLNRTAVAPANPLPLMRTEVPTGPLLGENEEIVGAVAVVVTVKFVALIAVPLAVFTVIGPVVAPVGTLATICVAAFDVIVAITPLNFTQVAPVRLVPLIVTEVPTDPLDGENEEIVGAADVVVTVKFVALVAVPLAVFTVIGPVVAPVGTSVPICVAVLDGIVAITPLNLTQFIVTEVPTGPVDGENELMVGSPLASAEGTARRPTRRPPRARHAETRRGSRPAFISMLPTRAGTRPIVAPGRYT